MCASDPCDTPANVPKAITGPRPAAAAPRGAATGARAVGTPVASPAERAGYGGATSTVGAAAHSMERGGGGGGSDGAEVRV